MRSGKLRHRIDIQAATESQGRHGGARQTWSTIATRWGGIRPLTGREALQGAALEARVSHEVDFRYVSWLTPHHRLLHAGRVFNVHGVINVGERNRATRCMCEEVV